MDRKRSRTENGSQPGGGAAAVESSDSGADSDSDFDDFDDDGSQSAFSSDGEAGVYCLSGRAVHFVAGCK
eukprot:gene13682-6888_t